MDQKFAMDFLSIEEDSDSRDGLPSIGVTQGHKHSHGSLLDRLLEKRFSNSSSDNADIAISRVFHDDEMSEQLRQSDLKVQNLPASVSPSELRAHQMGGTLAGRFGHERVGGHPPDYLSLQDRAPLRRYSKVYCDEAVQNKSDGLRSRGDEPTRTIKDVSADASCLGVSTETVVSPVPIAVTVSPTKDDLADGQRKRKRRRYTGKAVKNNVKEQVPIIKDVPADEKLQVQSSRSTLVGVAGVPIIPVDLEVSAVKRSSSLTLDGCNRVAEVLVPHSSLHPADLGFIQKLGATDFVMLYYTQACFEGLTARKDAELAERSRWISLLVDLLRNTTTPMGRLLRENPANSQLLGARASAPEVLELARTGSQLDLSGPLEATG